MARKGQITFEKLNSLFKAILILDSDKRDFRISKIEYENIKEKQNVLKDLIGNRRFDSWDTFKTAFIDNQNQYNVIWKQAQGGSLYLEEILLTEDLGYEIAIKLLDKIDVKDGEENLFKYFKEFLPDLLSYIGENLSYITLNDFKEGFKAADKKNFSFKFKQGRNSTTFIKTLNTYTYLNKDGSQDEIQLGNEILERLKSRVGLDRLDHNQTERSGGKYQNYDFTGYKRKTTPFNDSIDIYSFELKPSNKIEYISDSISQATNYRSTSNYAYIIIPMFDKKLFHDEARFETYYELCKSNKNWNHHN
ncbi:MAG: hypothetical protein IPG24_12855 [Leptospiraceae bacterium]|nr:hypothetical protein [Leptospiraceae bacterium]